MMMKIAVLSDIHGNHIALETCIEEIERRNIDKLIFLGDYVGELAYPQKHNDIYQRINAALRMLFCKRQ